MNNFNHKSIGRYCYGGKIYAGQCDCGHDILIGVEQLKVLVEKSYVKPNRPVFTKFLALF
jgi:hypothetical protein